MYTQEMKEKALSRFLENPYWREYYETAPSEECKDRIVFTFCFSLYGDEGFFASIEDFKNAGETLESKLGLADWKHLLKYAGVNPFRSKCGAKIEELEAKQRAETGGTE